MKFEIYLDGTRQWRWRLKAQNGRIIADSAEAYHNETDCRGGIALVKLSVTAPIVDLTIGAKAGLSQLINYPR